jgi:hypothetical protein
MRCGLASLLLASLLISTSALSDEKDASHYCKEKLAAGLAYRNVLLITQSGQFFV